MSGGYMGKILRINLTGSSWREEPLPEDVKNDFLGGRGFAAYYLFRELRSGIDALSPENKVLFATGPLVGIAYPGCTGYAVFGKSPLTGGWGEAHAKGRFGPQIKACGYDVIIVEGAASKPTYLWVQSGKVEFRSAEKLWGMTTGDTEDAIRAELGAPDARMACIGIGGENLVKYAGIINDKSHAAGRTGLGAVMGSKNLKALVCRGTQTVPIHDPEKLAAERSRAVKGARESSFWPIFHKYGTAGLVPRYQAGGVMPTRNYQSGQFESFEAISGQKIGEKYIVGHDPCPMCPMACDHQVEVKTGPFAPVFKEYGDAEYESIAALGSYSAVANVEAILKANMLCNMYGIDTISTGSSIAFAIECHEHGIISDSQTNGVKLEWGNGDTLVNLVEKIARREGLGDLLAEGVKCAAEKLGGDAAKYAVFAGNMECPMVEPRAEVGKGLSYAVSNRGACHHQYTPFFSEREKQVLGGITIPPKTEFSLAQAENVVRGENYRTILPESLILCSFVTYENIGMLDVANVLQAVTGREWTVQELLKTGERIWNLCRCFNVREGRRRKDDRLPPRFAEPLDKGPTAGYRYPQEALEQMLDDYYELRGWSKETGVPTRAKLHELGLDFAVAELEQIKAL